MLEPEFPTTIAEGTLQPIGVDGVEKILQMKNGEWVDIVTGLPPPKDSKIEIVSLGHTDRFGS